jgi:Lon-like protease
MSHRRETIVVSAVLLAVLTALAVLLPVPYVRMSPGPAVDILGGSGTDAVMQITGHETFPTSGRLELTTVSATSPDDHLTLTAMLAGWLDPKVAVVPRSYLYPPTVTSQQIEQQNAEEMTGSQNAAIVAGLTQAKVPGTKRAQVTAVVAGSPAEGNFKAADFVLSVNGKAVAGPDELRKAIRDQPPGTAIVFQVRRDGKPTTVTVTSKAAPDDPAKSQVGIEVGLGFDSAVHVDVRLPQQIGGPSAGMMFALSLYDKLTPGSLTGGRTVAGTGTIEENGAVGPIGGIEQKLYGARDSGATVFLAPAADCDAAAGVHIDGLQVFRVATLNDSVTVLSDLDAGRTPSVARCG